MKYFSFIILIFFSITAGHISVFASGFPLSMKGQGKLPVDIVASEIEYDRKNNYMKASGDVEITQGSRILKADHVRLNILTNDAEATGNVMLKDGEDVLYCDAFSLNFETQLGTVSDARLFIMENNFHINGEDVERTGLNQFRIRQGSLTTCDDKINPPWRIDAENIKITINGYAKLSNSRFRVKGVPVLYVPYMILPVKTQRQSGLLIPEAGYSSSRGVKFNNSFFWAISDSQDATVWLDYYERKGFAEGLEYRYRRNEQSWGKFYGYFTKERSRYFRHEYRDLRDRGQERGFLNFEGEEYFTDDFYIKAQGSYVTDREFYGDYSSQVRRTRSQWKKTSIRSLEKDESNLFMNKNWDFYNLIFSANLYKNLMHGAPDTVQELPRVLFSTTQRPFWRDTLFFQMDSSYDYFWRERGEKGHRVDFYPKISIPFNYNGWLKLSPEIGFKNTMYFGLSDHRGYDKTSHLPTARVDFSTTFMRVYSPGTSLIEKLKHTLEPGVVYEYIEDDNQKHLPSFDIQDDFFRRNSVSYYLKNRFTGLFKQPTGGLEEYEIGYLMVGQTYNIKTPKRGLYLKGDERKNMSDIFAELRLGVLPSLYLKTKTYYSTHRNNLSYFNTLVNWSNYKGEYLQFEYIYSRDMYETVDLQGRISFIRNFYLFFDVEFDTRRSKYLDTEFGIDYAHQCWGGRISLEKSRGTGGRSSDTSINFSVYLKGIGETIK